MKTRLLLALPIVSILLSTFSTFAQTSPFQIESFQVEKATLPGGKKPWTKLVCTLQNNGPWSDGLSFGFSVLVEPAGNPSAQKVLSGGATYLNVPPGKSQAIMYLSPNATARFGEPIAATVQLDRGERTIQIFPWSGKSVPDAGWAAKYPTQNGMLLNLRSTPWILLDAERGGDLLVN